MKIIYFTKKITDKGVNVLMGNIMLLQKYVNPEFFLQFQNSCGKIGGRMW